jgi:hypothetical protein
LRRRHYYETVLGYCLLAVNSYATLGAVLHDVGTLVVALHNVVFQSVVDDRNLVLDARKCVLGGHYSVSFPLNVADGRNLVLDARKCVLGGRYSVSFPLCVVDGHSSVRDALLYVLGGRSLVQDVP